MEHNGRYVLVQVKSTSFQRRGSYTCNIESKTGTRYMRGKLDVFAVYLVPIDLWYIIPFEVAARNLSLNLTPYDGHKFAQYMEAWHLLQRSEARRNPAAEAAIVFEALTAPVRLPLLRRSGLRPSRAGIWGEGQPRFGCP